MGFGSGFFLRLMGSLEAEALMVGTGVESMAWCGGFMGFN